MAQSDGVCVVARIKLAMMIRARKGISKNKLKGFDNLPDIFV